MKKFTILFFLLPLIAVANDDIKANHLCPYTTGAYDQVISMQIQNNTLDAYMINPQADWNGVGTYYYPPTKGQPYSSYCLDILAGRKTDTAVATWANNLAQSVTEVKLSNVMAFVTDPYAVKQSNYSQYTPPTSLNWAVETTIEIETGDQNFYICNNFIFGQNGGKDDSDIYWIYMNIPNPNNTNNTYIQCNNATNNMITYFSLSTPNINDSDGWITMTRVGGTN